MRYFEQQRHDFIAQRIQKPGFINRSDIMQKFGVSTPTASHDLTKFQDLHPGQMVYDATAKRYQRVNGEAKT